MDLEQARTTLEKLTNKNISNTELSFALGMKLPNISRKLKDESKLKAKQIRLIEEYFKITLPKENDNNDNPKEKISTDECITLERIHIAPSCGSGTIVLNEAEVTPITLGKKLIQNVFRVGNLNDLKVFTATGDSMEPTIFNGDDVLVNIGDCNFNNGGIFIIEKFGDWFIKRLSLRFDGNLEIISDNKKYDTQVIKYDDGAVINIRGRVIKNLSRGL